MNSKMKEAKSRPSDALEAPLAGKLSKSPCLSLADSPSKSKSTPPQSHLADPPSMALSNQVYLFFWHAYSPVMYTLYKIDIPRPLPPPPAKASQDLTPSLLHPMLTLKTGKYPDRMCCVQLGSKLYFLGGEFNITNPYIDEDVIKELKNVKRDVFPPDVYILDLANHHPLGSDTLNLSSCKPMNSGKASPRAFVADGKIYVIGSTIQMNIIDKSKLKDLDLESFAYFEVYDPEVDMWNILPNPPIRDMNTKWVGHAVVGESQKTALLTAWQRGKECVYFFDLGKHQWKKYASLPSYPGNFSGRIEYVEDTVYGCYGNTIAAIAPLAAEEEEEEEEEEEKEEEEEEEEEIEEVQRLLKHHSLHLVSEEMDMDAIFNVPLPVEMGMDDTFNATPQLQSSSSLLHLGNKYFCYVKTGMPPQMIGIDKRQFISVVIFQALGKTYKKDATRFFSAEFLHSVRYAIDNPFPSEGFIDGFFCPGCPGLLHLDPTLSDTEDFFSPGLLHLIKSEYLDRTRETVDIFSPEMEIYQPLQGPSISAIELTCNQSSHSVVEALDDLSSQPSPGLAALHKSRMKWTPWLHVLFVDAVTKLGGAEHATPKRILNLMNVKELTVYHVKSHLEKYRRRIHCPVYAEKKSKDEGEELEIVVNNEDVVADRVQLETVFKNEDVVADRVQLETVFKNKEQLKASTDCP